MRWTICYMLMMACMVSALGYGVYSATCPARECNVGNQTMEDYWVTMPHAAKRTTVAKVNDEPKSSVVQALVAPGATREQVLQTLGQPDSTDADNTRWYYGRHTIIFKNDAVMGCVSLDEMRARELAWNRVMAPLAMEGEAAAKQKPAARAATARRVAHAKPHAARRSAPRHASSGGSGFATVWEPMFRPFYSDKPLPRNRPHVGSRHMPGQAGYRNAQLYRPTHPIYIRK